MHPKVVSLRPHNILPAPAIQRHVSEVLGTFAILCCGTGAIVINQESHGASPTRTSAPPKTGGAIGACRACVISNFRLAQRNLPTQFYKVVLHELGHTQGLAHCPAPTRFMRDAAGGNPTNQETGFCPRCTTHLRQRGWQLPPAS